MKNLSLQSTLALSSGVSIPVLGLGVWKMKEGKETEYAVQWALEAGYRHIDTAKLYGNEHSVGRAVRASGIPRSEIFITTKLWPTDFFNPEAGFKKSLELLDLDYIDLYLIHWPAPIMPKSIWQVLERMHEQGLVRSIGVSNYGEREIDKLLEYAKVLPAVNQVIFNPESYDLSLLEFCKAQNIVVEAYSPLGEGSLIKNKTVVSVAEKYKKTSAQILIRWALQYGTIVLPKSSNHERIKQNTQVFDFELSSEDMKLLDSLG